MKEREESRVLQDFWFGQEMDDEWPFIEMQKVCEE